MKKLAVLSIASMFCGLSGLAAADPVYLSVQNNTSCAELALDHCYDDNGTCIGNPQVPSDLGQHVPAALVLTAHRRVTYLSDSENDTCTITENPDGMGFSLSYSGNLSCTFYAGNYVVINGNSCGVK